MDPHHFDFNFKHHTFLDNLVCESFFQTFIISIPLLLPALCLLTEHPSFFIAPLSPISL